MSQRWIFQHTTDDNLYGIEATDLRSTPDFESFRQKLLQIIEICGDTTFRMLQEQKLDAYWVTLALDDLKLAKQIGSEWTGYCTVFFISCGHGNRPEMCFEVECMGDRGIRR